VRPQSASGSSPSTEAKSAQEEPRRPVPEPQQPTETFVTKVEVPKTPPSKQQQQEQQPELHQLSQQSAEEPVPATKSSTEKRRRGGEIVSLDVSFGRRPPLPPQFRGSPTSMDSRRNTSEAASAAPTGNNQEAQGHEPDLQLPPLFPSNRPRSVSSLEGSVYTAVSRLAQRRQLPAPPRPTIGRGGQDASHTPAPDSIRSSSPAASRPSSVGRSTPNQQRPRRLSRNFPSNASLASSSENDDKSSLAGDKQLQYVPKRPSLPGSNPSSEHSGTISNRKLIVNALTYVSLAGTPHEETRTAALEVLKHSQAQHFYVALKRFKFVGLYVPMISGASEPLPGPDPSVQEETSSQSTGAASTTPKAVRIFGDGPLHLSDAVIEAYFKYDSAGKQWKPVHAYGLNPSIDAVNILPQYARRRAVAAAAAASAAATAVTQSGALDSDATKGSESVQGDRD